jgi:hypothetical protein
MNQESADANAAGGEAMVGKQGPPRTKSLRKFASEDIGRRDSITSLSSAASMGSRPGSRLSLRLGASVRHHAMRNYTASTVHNLLTPLVEGLMVVQPEVSAHVIVGSAAGPHFPSGVFNTPFASSLAQLACDSGIGLLYLGSAPPLW